jgi:tetratricopeptide (TPR) repeat protein
MHRTALVRLVVLLALAVARAVASGAEDAQGGESGREEFRRGRYAEAERLFAAAVRDAEGRSLPVAEQAMRIESLAAVRKKLGRYEEAGALWRQALGLREGTGGPAGVEVGADLDGLADVAALQGRYDEAESLAARSISIKEAARGPEDRSLAESLAVLGAVARIRGRDEEAEWLYRRALALVEQGPEGSSAAHVSLRAGLAHQCEVAVVQVAHRWDESDAFGARHRMGARVPRESRTEGEDSY